MKKMRRGFTLVELLIVIAIVGALSAAMTMSSTAAIDSSQASAVLSNLQTMKTAAFEMYMEEPEIASLTTIKFDGTTETTGTNKKTVSEVLAVYLGKKSDAFKDSGAAAKYGLIGDANSWYVVYAFDENDTTGMKAKLAARANDADLYASKTKAATVKATGFTDYYANNKEACVALKVR